MQEKEGGEVQVGGGQLAHMSDIHFQCAECCCRRKREPDWEVRAGFLEEVRSCHWKGHAQFSRKREELGLRVCRWEEA